MQDDFKGLIAVLILGVIFLLACVTMGSAGERDEESLADVVRHQQEYWRGVRADSDRRELLQLETRQTEALEAIEQEGE